MKFSFLNIYKKFIPKECFLILVPCLWIYAHFSGLTESLETFSLNWRFKVRGELQAPIKIVYVDVDSKSIQLMGERPFPRAFFAQAIDSLEENGLVRAIGIDFVFSEAAHSQLIDVDKVNHDNQALRKVIQKYSNIVLAAAYTSRLDVLNPEHLVSFPFISKGYTDPDKNGLPEQPGIELIGINQGTLGLINIDETFSMEGIPQWIPVFAQSPGPTYYTMAVELLRIYHKLPKELITISDTTLILRDDNKTPVITIPLFKKQLMELNWFSTFYSAKNPRCSLYDLLLATELLQKGTSDQKTQAKALFEGFNDSIVLIGPTDSLLQDFASTPLDAQPVPKVGIHGNVIKTIASSAYIKHSPKWLDYILIFILGCVVTYFIIQPNRYGSYLKVLAIICILMYALITFILFNRVNYILPLVAPIGSAFTGAFLGIIFQLLYEEKQKSRIKNLFGTYVSPDLVQQMIDSKQQPQLGGIEQTVTAFFSDIENFSSFSEILNPKQLVELMNEYFTTMTDHLREEGGTLDKYIGDAIVAIFGAPVTITNHAYRACTTAIYMHKKEIELKNKWSSEKNRWPQINLHIKTRIGINTGLAVIGNMGSNSRFNYTMMGDSVNLAARCESGCKIYGIYTMVTEDVKSAAQAFEDTILFRELDIIIVKGRTHPVKIYELMGFRVDMTSETRSCVELYEQGLFHYRNRSWQAAKTYFEQSAKLEITYQTSSKHTELNPSLVFIERCSLLEITPPIEPWDGSFKMIYK